MTPKIKTTQQELEVVTAAAERIAHRTGRKFSLDMNRIDLTPNIYFYNVWRVLGSEYAQVVDQRAYHSRVDANRVADVVSASPFYYSWRRIGVLRVVWK